MDLSHLHEELSELDVDAAWAAYGAAGGVPDLDAFLAWLLDEGRISTERFAALHATGPITLSDATATWAGEVSITDGAIAEESLPRSLPEGTRYEVIGEIGRGAMGRVYVARDRELFRKVAFKELHPDQQSGRAVRRFLSEVQITAQLDHPSIVPVYDMEPGKDGGPAYAMKLVRGITLAELLKAARTQAERHGQPDEEHAQRTRVEHFLKVCDAVDYAHSKGVVHRDLKPANIMIGRYREVFVMDWGIARVRSQPVEDLGVQTRSGPGTRAGAVMGTPAYMSPEQAHGDIEQVGPRSDQFALGLLLHECLTLQVAYGGADVLETARAAPAPERPEQAAGEAIDEALWAIVAKATATDPRHRYRTVGALADDVRRALRGDPVTVLPETLWRRLRRWLTRNPGPVAALGVALFTTGVLAAGGLYAWAEVQSAQQRAAAQARQYALDRFRSRVALQGQAIDRHVLFYQGQLEAISAAAAALLTHGTELPVEPWRTQDFRQTDTAPPGLVASPHYHRPIHPVWPVTHVPPDTPEALWRQDFRRLAPLRHLLREVHLSRPEQPPVTDAQAQLAAITGDDVALEWAYFAVERSGVMYMFPGAAGWEDSYDPRTRPWYQDALEQRGAGWGRPYADLMGQGRLISGVKPTWAADGTLLGVAGVDLEFNWLTRTHMELDLPGFVGSYLLDEEGRILVATDLADAPFVVPPTEAEDEGLDYGSYSQPDVLAGARARTDGFVLADDASGRTTLTAWTPLASLGWTFVVVTRADALWSD